MKIAFVETRSICPEVINSNAQRRGFVYNALPSEIRCPCQTFSNSLESRLTSWDWLTRPHAPYTCGFVVRVVVKALALFALVNVAFVVFDLLPLLGQISVYNVLAPGRLRLPYGENSEQSYNLSLMSLDAMFSSHEVARPKAADEYRVLVLGDSATWGMLLRPEETLAGALNAENYTAPDGRRMRFYNLGHPVMSLAKDLLLLDYAMRYQPDAMVWLFTAQSFPREQQPYPPLVQHNTEAMRRLIGEYDLRLDSQDARFVSLSFLERTLVGRRRELADWLRLQLYGFAWAATGVDQYYPPSYTPRTEDFDEDVSWQGIEEPRALAEDDLAFDVLAAGMARAGDAPVLLVNEPMFISSGRNSDLRYNFFYPRWAYDSYRQLLTEMAEAHGWRLLDVWDAITPMEFTDSPVHLTPKGTAQLREMIAEELGLVAVSR